MRKTKVKITDWPFKKGEKAQLIWIGEPFKSNNKWMLYAYFKFEKITKRVLLDWASIHFLVSEKYYKDGDLNNGEALDKAEIVELNLTGAKVEYKERPWSVWAERHKLETKSKTFNFRKNGHLYSVPIVELIRAVLAPSDFLLNRILEMDTLENYFTYTISKGILELHFTGEYAASLLKEDKINHLAWLLTNISALKMFNKVGQNMWQLKELRFDFILDNFVIKARVEPKERYTKILEIVALKRKKINVKEINIYHPSLEETHYGKAVKLRKYINKKAGSDRDLTSEGNGTTKGPEEIETALVEHEYESLPQIHRRKIGARTTRKTENEITEDYFVDNDKLRATADTGGEELIKGLEFKAIDKVEVKGELEEFVEILKLLEKRPGVKKVDISIGELPEGRRAKRFARLSDGVTRRRYAIGKVTMMDGSDFCLIEVEREVKSLSMLILKGKKLVKWKPICSILLLSLVNKSGKWSNDIITHIQSSYVIVSRFKHIKKSVYEMEIKILEKQEELSLKILH